MSLKAGSELFTVQDGVDRNPSESFQYFDSTLLIALANDRLANSGCFPSFGGAYRNVSLSIPVNITIQSWGLPRKLNIQ